MFSVYDSTGGLGFTAWLKLGRREKKVRISQEADEFVQVKVIHAKRNKEGKVQYETVDTTKVFDATPEEVSGVVVKALQSASGSKK